MKRSLKVLSYIDYIISCIRGYVNVSLTFIFMGVLIYFQSSDVQFMAQQQNVFINMNTFSLTVCMTLSFLRWFLNSICKEKKDCKIFVEILSEILMYVLFNVYGRISDKPYTSINLELLIYDMAGFYLLSLFLQTLVDKISFKIIHKDVEEI